LDGTLIDSAPSILKSLQFALEKSGLTPVVPLENSLIGPPLKETIQTLVGSCASYSIDLVLEDFKKYYDHEGFRSSEPYPGIEDMLEKLTAYGISLHLATNKRLLPTQKIIDYLGWRGNFKSIYSIDKCINKPFLDKTQMLAELLGEQKVNPSSAVYVGDRLEDYEASKSNNLSTILVQWGYGDLEVNSGGVTPIASSAMELVKLIMRD